MAPPPSDSSDDARPPAVLPFRPVVADWFAATHGAPTPVQAEAWATIADGRDTLVTAPTGSGKTLAAFLTEIDSLLGPDAEPSHPRERCRVVYVSPLKALATDVGRNLLDPLAGITALARARGTEVREITVAHRTSDTSPAERRRFATRPADILVTTPESLYLLLTSGAREALRGVRTVVLDEIHVLAGTKRGAHLAVSLERLDALTGRRSQRLGLSATVAPLDRVAAFLSGSAAPATVVAPPATKHVVLDVEVPVADLADLTTAAAALPRREGDDPSRTTTATATVWPHVEERLVDLIAEHRTTLVFANSRRTAEKLTTRINEVWASREGTPVPDVGAQAPAAVMAASHSGSGVSAGVARAHHGSMSHEDRALTEAALKSGELRAVVATASLELGIDMGAIDLVVQVGAPPTVAAGLQRVGRAGHQVGATSRGVFLPLFRGELVPTVVTCLGMADGAVEDVPDLRLPLDVLSQQIVAMVADADVTVDDLAALVRRAHPFRTLGDDTLAAVLDMLSGYSTTEDLSTLRPRIVWDRETGVLSARPGSRQVAVLSGGTIPDRGLFPVYIATAEQVGGAGDDGPAGPVAAGGADGGGAGAGDAAATTTPARGRSRRVGELDEEMVFESHVGDTFTLGTSTWRIVAITQDSVLVVPAPGLPSRLPFWKGDSQSRPAQLGARIGAWLRERAADVAQGADPSAPVARGAAPSAPRRSTVTVRADAWAQDNLRQYLVEQRDATGGLPDDRHVLVESFPDAIGDWMTVVHSLWGGRVNTPWAMVLRASLARRFPGARVMASDDGLVIRTGATEEPPLLTLDDLLVPDDELDDVVRASVMDSGHFAARFREAAARSLVLPRGMGPRRRPLWQQRLRAGTLLAATSDLPTFPLALEALRECLNDDFDMPAFRRLHAALRTGEVQVSSVVLTGPSPFAQHLVGDFTLRHLYEDDAPAAERRATALRLDGALVAEVLGAGGEAGALATSGVGALLDADAVAAVERRLARLEPQHEVASAEDVIDTLRTLGPSPAVQLARRVSPPTADALDGWLADLLRSHRVVEHDGLLAVVEDAVLVRDGLAGGDTRSVPAWVAPALLHPRRDALGDLLRRRARTHAFVVPTATAAELGASETRIHDALDRLTAEGALVRLTVPARVALAAGQEAADDDVVVWCDPETLRLLRRRSLEAERGRIAAVEATVFATFLPRLHGVGRLRGIDGVLDAVDRLEGARLNVADLERSVLASRVVDYDPTMLDELASTGELVWTGRPQRGAATPGWISLYRAESLDRAPREVLDRTDLSPLAVALLEVLRRSSAFAPGLLTALTTAEEPVTRPELAAALWELTWAGLVTNDRFAVVRARGQVSAPTPRRTSGRPPRPRAASRAGAHVPADLTGRWSVLDAPGAAPGGQASWLLETLLARHGVLTRDVAARDVGADAEAVLAVARARAEAGTLLRGYFVADLAGRQYASRSAVDALRSPHRGEVVLLAADDPAQPYGAALPWPALDGPHRPTRRAGGAVVLAGGRPTLYLSTGGRWIVTFGDDAAALPAAADAVVDAVRAGRLADPAVHELDGRTVYEARDTIVGRALLDAGFVLTPRGLRLPRLA